ncbi:hypothetical protein IWQ57_001907, partial [Coemansia nantahalensis]
MLTSTMYRPLAAARDPEPRTPPPLAVCSDPYSQPRTPDGYARRACFATTSRLLACLVNEGLVDAYHASAGSDGTAGHLLVVPRGASPADCGECLISQLRHRPVTGPQLTSASCGGAALAPVLLLDPEDLGMGHWIQAACSDAAALVADAGQIMARVGRWNACDGAAAAAVASELASSTAHQAHAYAHRRPLPSLLTAAAIEWEQGIVEGHATHPMHRMRHAEPPLAPVGPETELWQVRLAFVAVPRSELRVEGAFDELLAPLYAHAQPRAGTGGRLLDHVDCAREVVLPVHPLHLPAVLAKFGYARPLPFALPAAAQLSLRTMVPEFPGGSAFNVKLALGVKTTSALRI